MDSLLYSLYIFSVIIFPVAVSVAVLFIIIKLFKIKDYKDFLIRTAERISILILVSYIAAYGLIAAFGGIYYSLMLKQKTTLINIVSLIILSFIMFTVYYFIIFRKNQRKFRTVSSVVLSLVPGGCLSAYILFNTFISL